MRIIKQPQEHTTTCDYCKAELAYFKSDIKFAFEELFGWHYCSYLRCPACNHKIILECE